jgi:hypothetical protein
MKQHSSITVDGTERNRTADFVLWPLRGILFILISSIVILSLVPPVSKDALVHHLALPKLYLKHGGIFEIPFMDFSYYPMNLDLLYMIPMYFGNDIAPKFIHFGFALLAAFLIYYYLKTRADRLYGLLGALFFVSIPIIVKLSITVYVDLGEICFAFAALFFLFEWLKKDYKTKYLVLSGIMCGLALGTKYTGLVTLFLLTLFVPFFYSRNNKGKKIGFLKPVGFGVIFLLISLMVFSPWGIRNYHWRGNPIYPLYDTLFNPTDPSQSISADGTEKEEQNKGFFTYRSMIYNEPGWYIALLPIRIFFEGNDGDPQFFDGRLNPFLFILPFFAFMGMKNDSKYLKMEKTALLGFSALFFCIALFSTVLRIRYISPIIPPLIILSIFGIQNLFKWFVSYRSSAKRHVCLAVLVGVLVLIFFLNASYIMSQFRYVRPFSYLTGSVSRDEYVSGYRPEYAAMEYINRHTDQDAKVYFIYNGKRGYYCDREYIFGMNIMTGLIDGANGPEDIHAGFRRQGITHILIFFHLFDSWLHDNFSKEKTLLTQRFFRENSSTLFVENGFGVLALNGS